MTLPFLITKPSSQPIWLVGTQVVAEHHQNKKLCQRENIGTILSITIYHYTPVSFNTTENVVNTATLQIPDSHFEKKNNQNST